MSPLSEAFLIYSISEQATSHGFFWAVESNGIKNQDMSQFMRRNHSIFSLSKILGVTTAAFDVCAGYEILDSQQRCFWIYISHKWDTISALVSLKPLEVIISAENIWSFSAKNGTTFARCRLCSLCRLKTQDTPCYVSKTRPYIYTVNITIST